MAFYKRITAILIFGIVGAFVATANVSFSVNAPRQVVQGDKFNVTYILRNGEGSGLRVGEIGGCTKLFGPATSTSYSQQWINGVSSSSSSQEYSITYRADKAGRYNVGGASISVNGKAMRTNGFSIEVLPPNKSASRGSSNSQSYGGVDFDDASTQTVDQKVKGSDLFVRINLSKPSAYEQEAIVCTIKLYTKYQISQFMPTLQPSFNGFLIEDLPITTQLNSVERVNGQNYMVAELKKCILYPQQSGKLTITSGNYDLNVIQYEEYRSIFGMMRQPVEKQLKVKSNSASVHIVPLPKPQPAGFSGAVGVFNISAKLKTNKFKTYESATLDYVISGTGNIKYVKAPEINFPSQFDVYDPQSTVAAHASGGNMTGSVKYEYTFTPQYVGDFTIPGSPFVYFNPNTKKYVTLTSPKFNLKVAKGVGTAANVDKKQIEQKNTDILHIKTGNLELSQSHSIYIDFVWYWLLYIIPIGLLITLLIIYRNTLKERANIQLMKTKRANKVAMKRLKVAKMFMEKHDGSKFYEEMLKAIWGYLGDKLGISVSQLNKENIEAELLKYGANEELINELIKVLDDCEFAQYAPSQSDEEMDTVYQNASNLMDKLENTKKKN